MRARIFAFIAGLSVSTALAAQSIKVETPRCFQFEKNIVVQATATPAAGQTPRLYFRWTEPKDEKQKPFYWLQLESEPGGRYWTTPPKPEKRNKEVELFGALADAAGQIVTRTQPVKVKVTDDCKPQLTDKEKGVAQNLTIGETVKEQQGDKVTGFLCDGLVTRINFENVRRADDRCRGCIVAWWQKKEILIPALIGIGGIGGVIVGKNPKPPTGGVGGVIIGPPEPPSSPSSPQQ